MSAPVDSPRPTIGFVQFVFEERTFLAVLLSCLVVTALTYQTPGIAMWVGFAFAGYSAIANDSIQTLGTFIASNREQRWWVLWLFVGGIFVATMSYSWFKYSGDVSYQRLTSKGFETAPESFSFLQVAAPLVLLLLTRLRMPVSTTFLLLSSFATKPEGIASMLTKSLSGYFLAIAVAALVWGVGGRWMKRNFVGTPGRWWRPLQWITTGWLWSVWLQQDAANIAVYLPRQLDAIQFLAFAGLIFFGLGVLFFQRGEKIQQVVDEKTNVVDVRPATVIDLSYAFILWYFKMKSNVPMSTTWVFIGLLGGREMVLSALRVSDGRTIRHAARIMWRDFRYASIGLAISLAIALAVNDSLRRDWIRMFTGGE